MAIGEPVWFAKQSEKRRWRLRIVAFVGGVLVGGVLFGVSLGALGDAVIEGGAWSIPALSSFAVAITSYELIGRGLPVPQFKWQVPQYWLGSQWRGYVAFGVVMGVGAFTRQVSVLYYVYPVACLAAADISRGALFGAIYASTFAGLFLYGTVAWRHRGPGFQGDRARALMHHARRWGAIAAPLIVLVSL